MEPTGPEQAHALWIAGRRDEAVSQLQEWLRLNPGDNSGARYTLAGYLLFLDRDDELEQLLHQYPDDASAAWAYTTALLAFRRQGDTIETRRLLKTARKSNKHVPAYLLGEKFPPAEPPAYYRLGSDAEAIQYIGSAMVGWKSTPGAVAWLRANVKPKRRKAATPKPKGPVALVKTRLKSRLPQHPDVWQADFRQLSMWVETGAEKVRPWMILVINAVSDLIQTYEVADHETSPDALWDILVRAMHHPMMGKAHRPAELQVRASARWEYLRPHLEEIGVRLTVVEELNHVDVALHELSEHLGGTSEPGLLDAPGVTPRLVAGLYEAAAEFFRLAPWKKVGYEGAIRVECDKFQGGPWYAVLMGQSGLTIGLALYEDLELLKSLWTGEGDDEENARRTVATTVTFGEEWDIPVADLEAARRHHWKVARADAYPTVYRKELGMSMRPPLAPELELMEGVLRAIPEFVNRRRQDDPTKETLTVPAATEELRLVLGWVMDA
jgi:tetratricopeptide (TPR) repeat protein